MKNGNRLEAIRYITLLNSITFHGGQSRLPRVHATGSIRIASPSQWLDALLRRDRKLGRGDREKAVLSRCERREGESQVSGHLDARPEVGGVAPRAERSRRYNGVYNPRVLVEYGGGISLGCSRSLPFISNTTLSMNTLLVPKSFRD